MSYHKTFQQIARAQYISHEKERKLATRMASDQNEPLKSINFMLLVYEESDLQYTMVTRSRTNRQNHATQDLRIPERYLQLRR